MNQRKWRGRLAALSFGVLAIPLAAAQGSVQMSAAEGGRLWFVELAGPPVADGNTLASVRSEKAAFRQAAAAAGVRYAERRSYDTLFNGLSIDVAPSERSRIARLSGVKALYPVALIQRPEAAAAGGSATDLVTALTMTGALVAQNSLGLTGAGVKVGIIDTGVDIDHPAFGGTGTNGTTPFPSARVVAGYDFVGDAYDAGGTTEAETVPVPDGIPDDCNGHGTHVAGIVGAGATTLVNGSTLKGVAPGVSLGAYRVFGCDGSSASDIILAAMERAYADGMQVINQSLGAARQWPQYPTAQASSRLVTKGVAMVASIGNNGPGGGTPDGLYAAGAPGVGDKVIGVGAYDNTIVTLPAFTVEPGGQLVGFNAATGAPTPPTSGSLPMTRTGTPTATLDGCPVWQAAYGLPSWTGGVNLAPGSVAGQAVLIRRGTCSFHLKALNAQTGGAAAVVLYNNAAGLITPTVAGSVEITIPVVMVSAADGVAIDAKIAAGPTTMTWGTQIATAPVATGGLISGFSSYGLTAELGLKPNLAAPGGLIYSTYPLEKSGFATLSGTSMSSPHVAGGVALMLQAEPKLHANAVMARLQNSADPKNWSGNPGLGFLDFAHRQGAGMLDIVASVQATTTVEPSQLSLGESEAGPATRTLTVTNRGASPVTYALSHVPALSSGPNTGTASYAPSGPFTGFATVSFLPASITVAPGGSASFTATITANAGLAERSLYGGYLVLTPQGAEGPVYRVPYAGLRGNYQSTVVLTPTANGFPWLAQAVGEDLFNRPNGATFTMRGDDIAYIVLHLDHMSRRVLLEAVDAVTGASWNRISLDEYVTRSATPGAFYLFTWDGKTFPGTATQRLAPVPNGQYRVKVWVLKALGDANNPAHWETWTSPVVTIARP